VSPRVREGSLHPRLQLSAPARPLNFTVRRRIVRTLAFTIGLCIIAVGAIGIIMPSAVVWIAQRFGTPAEWYAIGAVRVAFGLLLLSVAKTSRAPQMLRVVAFIPLLAGLGAFATPFVGVERARATLDWWSHLGTVYIRLSGIPLLTLGGLIAYACAPGRRAANNRWRGP